MIAKGRGRGEEERVGEINNGGRGGKGRGRRGKGRGGRRIDPPLNFGTILSLCQPRKCVIIPGVVI